MKKEKIFEGVATALVTPMAGSEIDYPALKKIIEFQKKNKVDALVVGGTTAEIATISAEERAKLFEAAKEYAEGEIKLIFGIGSNDTEKAIVNAKLANKIGCDGVLAVTPYYNKGTQRGVIEHYRIISEISESPVIIYNVPQRTGMELDFDILDSLVEIPNIVGIKEASDSLEKLSRLLLYSDKLWVYAGNDSATRVNITSGGVGVISVLSNALPCAMRTLCKLSFTNKSEALLLNQKLMPMMKAIFKETNPAPIKYVMSALGLCNNELRLPLTAVENSTRALLDTEISHLKEEGLLDLENGLLNT